MENQSRYLSFLGEVDREVCEVLKVHENRFKNGEGLLLKFRSTKQLFSRRKNEKSWKAVVEIVNEMCFAKYLLIHLSELSSLEYEPKVTASGKSIDFLGNFKDKSITYVDFKTIHPDTKDAWAGYQRDMKQGHFTDRCEVVLEKNWMGGEIYHGEYAARGKMLGYSLELEDKIAHIDKMGRVVRFVMAFCGNNFDLHLDKVEDFADFYRKGIHREDDPLAKMEAHYIKSKGIALKRNIGPFCYMERDPLKTDIARLVCPVRGPILPW